MGDASKARQKLGWSPTVTFQVKINIFLNLKINANVFIFANISGTGEGYDVGRHRTDEKKSSSVGAESFSDPEIVLNAISDFIPHKKTFKSQNAETIQHNPNLYLRFLCNFYITLYIHTYIE